MNPDSIIPIKEHPAPREGKRAVQCTVDLSSQSAVLDLVAIGLRGQVSQIPSIFFDNADNDFTVTMVMEGTLQRLVCPPNSQGYFRLLLPQKPRLGFSSAMPVAAFKVNLLNWDVEQETVWKVVDSSMGGTVTSVGLSAPVEFTVTGSPVTTSGIIGLAWASELANKVFAAPNGAPGTPSFRSLVAADIPALNYVTSVALTMPGIFGVAGSPITTAGTLAVSLNTQNANLVWAGPTVGGAATPTFRALVKADLPSVVPAPQGYYYGFITSNNAVTPNTKIDVGSGTWRDSTNSADLIQAGSTTIDLTTTGLNGLDTGALGTNKWYFIFAISQAGGANAGFLASLSPSAPTMPATYTLLRRIAAFKTDGSSHVIGYYQQGRSFLWNDPVTDVTTANPGTAPVLQTLNVPIGIIVETIAACILQADANVTAYISSPGQAGNHNASFPSHATFVASAAAVAGATMARIPTNTSGQIYYALNGSDAGIIMNISSTGWNDIYV